MLTSYQAVASYDRAIGTNENLSKLLNERELYHYSFDKEITNLGTCLFSTSVYLHTLFSLKATQKTV